MSSETWLLFLVAIMFFSLLHHHYCIKWLQVSGVWIEMYIKTAITTWLFSSCMGSMTRNNLWGELPCYPQWSTSMLLFLLCFENRFLLVDFSSVILCSLSDAFCLLCHIQWKFLLMATISCHIIHYFFSSDFRKLFQLKHYISVPWYQRELKNDKVSLKVQAWPMDWAVKWWVYVLITAFSNGNWKEKNKIKQSNPKDLLSFQVVASPEQRNIGNKTPNNPQTNREQVNKPWKL